MKEQFEVKPLKEKKSDLEIFFKGEPIERDVLSTWTNEINIPGGESFGLKKRYDKKFGENNEFEYVITTQESNKIVEKIDFELAKNDKNISEFTLNRKERLINNKAQIVWDLEHRIAQAKSENISGTDIYTWVENYLKILIRNNKIENDILFGEVHQPKVVEWFLKNNYSVTDDGQKILDELNNSKSYSLMPIQIKYHDYIKDAFWIPNEVINSESLIKKYNGEIRKSSTENQPYLYFQNEIDPEKLGCPVIKVTKKIV